MANHAVEVELFYSGDWQAAPAYVRDGISLSRGAPGEGQDAPPSSATLTLDNRTGAYNPRNPTGPLYGSVGRNTPLRVSADGSVRSTTEAASWAPQRAVKGDAWTALQGGGILRRLQQGKTPLKSSLERAILASNPVAYWPLSDGKQATVLLSGVAGGQDLTLFGARPGVVDGPAASGAAFVDVAGSPVSARGSAPTLPAAGWGVEFMFYIGALNDPAQQTEQVALQWYVAGNPWRVQVGYNPFSATAPYLNINGDIGTTDSFVGDTDTVLNGWNHVRVTFEQVGGNVEVELYVNGANTDSDSVAGSLGSTSNEVIVGQIVDPLIPDFTFEQVGVAHVAFYALADAADHSDAAFGYLGELAGVRFLRVLGEEGVTAVVVGDENDTQPMGPQPVDTLVNIVRECVRTDDGIMFEPRDQTGIAMRTGRDRYNADPVLALDYSTKGVGQPLAPVLDDQNTRNDVKAVRRTGSSARAVKLTGPLNVSDPIDDPQGVGRYDVQVDVNPASDDRLLDHATWHLHKGTVDEPRYPQVVIDLDADPTLTAAVNALEVGDRISIANLPADWHQGLAELLVLGIRESFPPGGGDFRRTVALVTIPASAYEVGIVGANDGSTDLRGQAVDTDLSTLSAGITATATTLSVATSSGVWTTDADDWNPALNGGGLYLLVGGEEMRVTNITGASSPQTFTVVRSTNDVFKTHDSGTPVHVAHPIRVGL